MGAPRARAGPDLVTGGVTSGTRSGGSAAAALDFAVAQILRDDTALGALPAVLGRLAETFGLRAALAFQPGTGPRVALTPTEFRLLAALVRHPGQTLSAEQLLELAWNDPLGVGPERVKFGVMRLRRKLGQGTGEPGASIEAVRGFGYRYVSPA